MHAKKRAEEKVIEALSDGKTIRLQTPTVILTVRSGVEKPHCSMVRTALRWEISRLRVSIEYICF